MYPSHSRLAKLYQWSTSSLQLQANAKQAKFETIEAFDDEDASLRWCGFGNLLLLSLLRLMQQLGEKDLAGCLMNKKLGLLVLALGLCLVELESSGQGRCFKAGPGRIFCLIGGQAVPRSMCPTELSRILQPYSLFWGLAVFVWELVFSFFW